MIAFAYIQCLTLIDEYFRIIVFCAKNLKLIFIYYNFSIFNIKFINK